MCFVDRPGFENRPPAGTVALTDLGRILAFMGIQSGGDVEELVDETDFACGPGFTQDAMAAADHAHDLEALDRGVGRLHRLKASSGPDHLFEGAVIGLNDVVQIF